MTARRGSLIVFAVVAVALVALVATRPGAPAAARGLAEEVSERAEALGYRTDVEGVDAVVIHGAGVRSQRLQMASLEDQLARVSGTRRRAELIDERIRIAMRPLGEERLVVVVRSTSYLDDLAAQTRPMNPNQVRHIAGDLHAVLGIHTPEETEVRYLHDAEIPDDAWSIGIEGVQAVSEPAYFEGEGLLRFINGGTFEGSLLIADIWGNIARRVEGDLIVAHPAHGVLLATGSKETKALEEMVAEVRRLHHAGGADLASRALLRRVHEDWVVHEVVE